MHDIRIGEELLILSVESALNSTLSYPLLVSETIHRNLNDISIKTLKVIRYKILEKTKKNELSPIDLLTWDKLYDTIDNVIIKSGVDNA